MNLNETFELMNKTANEGYQAFRKLAELNLATADKLFAKQVELTRLCFEAGSAQLENAKNVRRVDELLEKQNQNVREFGEALLEKNREVVELLTESREDYQKWAEAGLNQAREQLTKTAEKVRETVAKAA